MKRDEEIEYLGCEKEEIEIRNKNAEISEIIAAECIYCGKGIVDSIVIGFQNQELLESWKI
jgi:hypothetical protein